MASPRPRRRRLLLPTALAAILAIEVTGLAIARSIAASEAAATVATSVTAPASLASPTHSDISDRAGDRAVVPVLSNKVGSPPAKARPAAPTVPAKPTASGESSRTKPASDPRAATFRGRNHVWIPALRISAGIQSFPCSRSRPPDAGVYRWGCAGRNNVYLLAHAWSTFKPLHDAYVAGRLRAGMKVWYGDGSGRVHEYSVAWWRVVAPTTAASWAWAAQTRPSMTLQTCVGANSQYRLMVRLFQVR